MKVTVQILVVREIEVEASDELQAERAAYANLGRDRDSAIGLCVMGDNQVGAMDEDNRINMQFVREKFNAIDVEWCQQAAL